MAWIEVRQSLRNHPKLTRLQRILELSQKDAIGLLVLLWWWCLDYAEDGQLGKFTDDEIAAGACWPEEGFLFVNALADCGFLDAKERRIHDWLDYAGLYLMRKYGTSNRKKLVEIWNGYGLKYGTRFRRENLVYKKRTKSVQKVNLPNQPNHTLPNHTLPTVHHGARAWPAGKYEIPEPKLAPADALVMLYKVLKGVPYEHVGWDEKWGKYNKPHAEKLLKDCGSYDRAYACLEYYAGIFNEKGFKDWTLRAIADRAVEWVASQEGKHHGTSNSERFFKALREQRSVGDKDSGLRAATEAGQVLGAVRNHQAFVDARGGREKRAPANGHGGAVGTVRPGTVEGKTDRGGQS